MAYTNIEDRKAYHRKWYNANREKRKNQIYEHRKNTQNDLRIRVAKYLKSHPCLDCGETDIIVLDFDHTSQDKLDDISSMITRALKWETILAEIRKCDVVCSNDHRRRTMKRGNHFRYQYALLAQW